MSGWRSETDADLRDARERIESLLSSVSGEPTEEEVRSIWRSYLDVEKSIIYIRVEIREENPGRFLKIKDYAVPDERQALQFALKSLKKGHDDFLVGDFQQALKDLRTSRNYLRALLRAKRLLKTRRARAARKD